MRFLANENFPADAVSALRDQEHDVAWIRTDSPGISDLEVLDRAQREDRILITFDKDFGEPAFRLKLPSLLKTSWRNSPSICHGQTSFSIRRL